MKDRPTPLESAILKTMLYGAIFSYPLTEAEIHHFLIQESAPLEGIRQTLQDSDWLAQKLIRVNGYYALEDSHADLRHERAQISAELWQKALFYGRVLAYIPFVRMVALTGALAMQNAAHPEDDFDYLIVTTTGRVWLARFLIVIGVRLARLRGVELCPNYVLTEAKLEQAKKDLYIAHELAQMIPLSGHAIYDEMRRVNLWAADWMPNAQSAFHPTPVHRPQGWGRGLQAAAEWFLGGPVGDWLENWELRRKAKKFAQEAQRYPHSAAAVDTEQVKGHFNDYGHFVLAQYQAKLAEYELD